MTTSDGKKKSLANSKDAWIYRMAFVDKSLLAADLDEDRIQVWDTASGKSVEKHAINKWHFEPARTNSTVAARHLNTVTVLDVRSSKSRHAFPGHRTTPAIRYALHSKSTLISRDFDTACYWDAKSCSLQSHLHLRGEYSRSSNYVLRIDMDSTASLEKQIYAKAADYQIELRDLKTDKLLRPLQHCTDEPGVSYFSPAGNRLYVRDAESLDFYDAGTGERFARLDRPRSRILGFRETKIFSSYGKLFATNDAFSTIDVFDVASGELIRQVGPEVDHKTKKHGSVLSFRFSEDEKALFGEVHETTDREDGSHGERVSVRLWDIASGKIIKDVVVEHDLMVFWRHALIGRMFSTMAMSNDRRYLALTRLQDNTIEIWEVASGTKRGELPGHVGRVADLAFSPDGRQLASSSDDTTILLWDVNRPLQAAKFASRLSAEEVAAHWKTLFQADAMKADTAIWGLVKVPDDSLPHIKKHVVPAVQPDSKHVQSLLRQLNSGDFRARSKAESELEGFGERVLADLEESRKQKNSVETQRRLEELIAKARKAGEPFDTLERIGQWRALEVLERVGSPAAVQILRDVAGGARGAQLTVAAQSVLSRFEKR